MKILFQIGPISIYLFGTMIAVGALAGIYVLSKEVKKVGFNPDLIVEGVLYSLLAGFIGARVFYILFYNPAYYLANPREILAIAEGGLSIHGGLLGGFFTAFLFLRKHKLPFLGILDLAVPPLILAQGISRIGCDVFGKPMVRAWPWGVLYNGVLVHPAQVYEFLLDYLLFFYLWIRRDRVQYQGQIFGEYLIGFSLIRGVVEFFRINPIIYPPFSISHLLSLGGIAAGIVVILVSKNLKQKPLLGYGKRSALRSFMFTVLLMTVSVVIFYIVQG